MFDTMLSRDVRQTLDHFRRTVDQFFDSFYGTGSRLSGPDSGSDYAFTPVIESGWNENELILEGERKAPEGWTSGSYPRIAYGKFYASVPLPSTVNVEQVKCKLHDGVLDIHFPLAEEMKPRQIPIETGVESEKAKAAIAA